jgi:hypothetical protein
VKSSHILTCAALIVAAIALVAAGVEGAFLLPFVGCALMMGAMMWMMTRPRAGGSK